MFLKYWLKVDLKLKKYYHLRQYLNNQHHTLTFTKQYDQFAKISFDSEFL